MKYGLATLAKRIVCLLLLVSILIPFAPVASATNFSSLEPGDTFTFGSCEQDNDKSNGYEPIEWIVLRVFSDRIVAISKYCLAGMSYYNPSGVKYKYTTWEKSDIRAFLNNKFYKFAFTAAERKKIVRVHNVNRDNSKYGTDGGNDTNDYVFLLSYEECKTYMDTKTKRSGKPTAYCKSCFTTKANCGYPKGKYCYWWLRTPGAYRCNAEYIFNDGGIMLAGSDVGHNAVGVRPAIVIYTKSGTPSGTWTNPDFN